jgi:hypothetical protein
MIVTKGKVKIIIKNEEQLVSIDIEPYKKLLYLKKLLKNFFSPPVLDYRLYYYQKDVTPFDELNISELFKHKSVIKLDLIKGLKLTEKLSNVELSKTDLFIPYIENFLNNEKSGNKFKCNCNIEDIQYICRSCCEFACYSCKDKHSLYELMKIDIENDFTGLKYYANAINNKIDGDIKAYEELREIRINDLNLFNRKESLKALIDGIYNELKQIEDRLPKLLEMSEFKDQSEGIKLNNSNIIKEYDNKKDNDVPASYEKLILQNKSANELSQNIYLMNFSNDITNQLDALFRMLEEVVKNLLINQKLLTTNFNNNFDKDGKIIIKDNNLCSGDVTYPRKPKTERFLNRNKLCASHENLPKTDTKKSYRLASVKDNTSSSNQLFDSINVLSALQRNNSTGLLNCLDDMKDFKSPYKVVKNLTTNIKKKYKELRGDRSSRTKLSSLNHVTSEFNIEQKNDSIRDIEVTNKKSLLDDTLKKVFSDTTVTNVKEEFSKLSYIKSDKESQIYPEANIIKATKYFSINDTQGGDNIKKEAHKHSSGYLNQENNRIVLTKAKIRQNIDNINKIIGLNESGNLNKKKIKNKTIEVIADSSVVTNNHDPLSNKYEVNLHSTNINNTFNIQEDISNDNVINSRLGQFRKNSKNSKSNKSIINLIEKKYSSEKEDYVPSQKNSNNNVMRGSPKAGEANINYKTIEGNQYNNYQINLNIYKKEEHDNLKRRPSPILEKIKMHYDSSKQLLKVDPNNNDQALNDELDFKLRGNNVNFKKVKPGVENAESGNANDLNIQIESLNKNFQKNPVKQNSEMSMKNIIVNNFQAEHNKNNNYGNNVLIYNKINEAKNLNSPNVKPSNDEKAEAELKESNFKIAQGNRVFINSKLVRPDYKNNSEELDVNKHNNNLISNKTYDKKETYDYDKTREPIKSASNIQIKNNSQNNDSSDMSETSSRLSEHRMSVKKISGKESNKLYSDTSNLSLYNNLLLIEGNNPSDSDRGSQTVRDKSLKHKSLKKKDTGRTIGSNYTIQVIQEERNPTSESVNIDNTKLGNDLENSAAVLSDSKLSSKASGIFNINSKKRRTSVSITKGLV